MSGSVFLLRNFRLYKLFSKAQSPFSAAFIASKPIDTTNNGNKWQNFYENYIRLPELKDAQEKVLKVENDYLSSQKEKNQCWQLLLSAQSHLKDIHAQLDPIPTIDNQYPQLLAEEVEVLKKIRSLSLDFNLYDRTDKEKMAALSLAIAECVKAEKICERRVFKLLLLAVLAGLIISFIVTYVTYNLYLYLSLDTLKKNNLTLKHIIIEFNLWIESQNKKIKSYLGDVWRLVGFERTISGEDFLFNPSLGDNDKTFVEKSNQFYELSSLENESTLHEMISIEDALLLKKEFHKLPTLVVEKDDGKLSDRGLWATTFGYGSAAILVPLAFFLLA